MENSVLQVVPSTSPKLAMKCLTVNYRSCFGGAKASLKLFCFKSFTQTQGSFVWPLPITGTIRREKSFFGTLSFCPQLFHSALPDCQDPSLCGSCPSEWHHSPRGPGQTPRAAGSGQVLLTVVTPQPCTAKSGDLSHGEENIEYLFVF